MSKNTPASPAGPLETLRRAWNDDDEPKTAIGWGLVLLIIACALGVRQSIWFLRGVAANGEVVSTSRAYDTCSLEFEFTAADARTFTLESGESTSGYCSLSPGFGVPVRYFPNNPLIAKPFPGGDDWIWVAVAGVPGLVCIIWAYWKERSRWHLLSAGPAPLHPGEVRVEMAEPAQSMGQPAASASGPSIAILYALLAGLVAVPAATAFVTPNPLSAAESRFAVPPEPTTAPAYAMTLSEHEPETSEGSAPIRQLRFDYEVVQVIAIPPGEISPEDQDHLIEFSGSAGPGVTYANRDGKVPFVRPNLMHGDVDIRCGEIAGSDTSAVQLAMAGGNLAGASIENSANGVRGPPRRVRRIYVDGEVKNFEGPELFRQSVLESKVVDLAPGKAGALALFDEQMKRLAEKTGVPAEKLKTYAGQVITVAIGDIVKNQPAGEMKLGVDESGFTRPEDDIRDRGNSSPLKRGAPDEHQVEPEMPHAR